MKTLEIHHGKSKTRAKANQIHIVATVVTTFCFLGTTAWYRGFESKSDCEQQINPVETHDKSDIISEMEVGKNKNKMASHSLSWQERLQLLSS